MLNISNVRKQFATTTAVDDVTLDVREGEIFALLGPNGAGKSTLLRMVLGLVEPDAGSIAYTHNGGSTRLLPTSMIGYLPEDRGLYPDVAVLRTLVHFGVLRGMARNDAATAARHWLGVMGLADRETEQLKALSKGNQQKVQFISAILHAPAFAVLDEPFSGLDPINQDVFLGLIRGLQAAGTTVILSAHQMPLVERIADRIAVMKQGRVILNGTLSQIRSDWTTGSRIRLRLASPPENADSLVETMREQLSAAEVQLVEPAVLEVFVADGTPLSPILAGVSEHLDIRSVESREVTLHDVYVAAIGGRTTDEPASQEAAQ